MNRFLVRILICTCLILINSLSEGQVQEGFPYTAAVAVPNAVARSGPGNTYYSTQKMVQGDSVEVYCELPTGWAAIRPPAGSYSWVRGKFLETLPDGTGKINSDNTASGVGSSLEDKRDVVQVRMRKGESVEVLQKSSSGSEVWYKISPPSGEFRWISLNDIIADNPLRRTAAQNQRDKALPPPPGTTAFQPQPGENANDAFYRELNELEQGWQNILKTDPKNWHTQQLLQRAKALKQRADTKDKFERVDILVSRLEKANDIALASGAAAVISVNPPASYNLPDNNGNNNPASNFDVRPPATTNQVDIDNLNQAATLEKNLRLDGVGLLSPLPISSVDNLPIRWALLDASGQVRFYISPSLGVHFKGLEGRVVGVVGSREYLPNNDKHIHITVRMIKPI